MSHANEDTEREGETEGRSVGKMRALQVDYCLLIRRHIYVRKYMYVQQVCVSAKMVESRERQDELLKLTTSPSSSPGP